MPLPQSAREAIHLETVRRGCRGLLLALLLLVSWLAFAPAELVIEPFAHTDKFKHVLAFAALSVVAGVGWWHARAAAQWVSLGLLAFGVFIELVQSRIPTRDASAADVVADTLGIVLGLVLVRTLSGRKPPPTS